MDESAIIVLFLLMLIAVLVLGCVGLFTVVRWIVRLFTGEKRNANLQTLPLEARPQPPQQCVNCERPRFAGALFCPHCGAHYLTTKQKESLRDLAVTLQQLARLHDMGAIDEVNFRVLKIKIDSECELIIFPNGRPGTPAQVPLFAAEHDRGVAPHVTARPETERETETHFAPPLPVPPPLVEPAAAHSPSAGAPASDRPEAFAPAAKQPRKPFAEVLASFMEQSNIRWGEIVGGMLIIGCSTALVISLWAQISRIPVLKFLIFTTVTAALFGVGFYTEHRWKLPTTSRGILTIATLLVPLNFLAIAAVSGSTIPPGALVIGSELIAPAIFLCLVYFAGRIITSDWPHLLAAGVLGSSAGQLLIRHFAAPDNSPELLLALGAFPILCYVAAVAWMLRVALADAEIDEGETNAIFVTLGAVTFAALLPFGLLLYKSGPVGMSMMYLAPLVTLGGMPMLASGTLIWRRVTRPELAASRTAGTSIAILGMAAVLAGMILAWPNPASIVPAALFNFAVFTALAVLLELPAAHVFAAGCLTFAYVVFFQVIAGNVRWQNLRVTSLLHVTASISTGQALTGPFVLFVLTSEWLRRKLRERDAYSYLIAACAVAAVSLLFVTLYGLRQAGDPHNVWAILTLYTAGAFWFAWRERSIGFSWAGATLLFFTSAQICVSLLSIRFPWQATMLLFAFICVAGAIVAQLYVGKEHQNVFVGPLRRFAIAGSVVGAIFILAEIISRGFEPAALLSTRLFWLAAIWLSLLLLGRATIFFTAFQITLFLAAALFVKSSLQSFEWYAYQPNAWLHPWALQIQGSIAAFICLAWITIRLLVRSRIYEHATDDGSREAEEVETKPPGWLDEAWKILDMPVAFDHLVAAVLLISFAGLVVFGTMTGIGQELATGSVAPVRNLAGFPHEIIFGGGGWILWAILFTVMLGNLWERGRKRFALGAVLAIGIACPLLAGRFEAQVATASAWRWFAAILLLFVSIAFSFRERFADLFAIPDSASLRGVREKLSTGLGSMRALLLFMTLAPLLLLTILPVVSEIRYEPARGPHTGFFQWIGSVALYSVPLIFTAIALAVHAARERAPAFAFAAGLFVNLAVTVVHLLTVVAANGLMDRVVLAHTIQLNAIAAAAVALAWMATRTWWMPKENESAKTQTSQTLLRLQTQIAVLPNAILIVPVAVRVAVLPDRAGIGTFAVGELNGWLALLLAIAVVIAFDKVFLRPLRIGSLCAALLAAGSLFAFSVARFGVANWLGFHVLLLACAITAWLIFFARDVPALTSAGGSERLRHWLGWIDFADDWEWESALFASVVGAVTVLLALRGPLSDPTGAWWSIGALVSVSALAAALQWQTLKRGYLYAAAVLFQVAFVIWLTKYQASHVSNGREFLEANVIALCLSSVLWLWLELRARQLAAQGKSSTALSVHNLAALLSMFVMGSVVAVSLTADAVRLPTPDSFLFDWLALVSLGVLMIACLWDRRAEYAVAGLYLIGLMQAGLLLHHLRLSPHRLGWAAMMFLAIQALVASLLWRGRVNLIKWATQLKIPARMDSSADELKWLTVFNSVVVAAVVWLAFWIDLRFLEWTLRATAALAVMAQALTFGFMARGRWRARWQRAAASMFIVGAVFLGWSSLMPGARGTWLNRGVILMTEMFAIVAVFGAGIDKLIAREPDWTRAIRDCVPWMTVTGAVSLAFVLSDEVFQQIQFGAVYTRTPALITVGVTLAAAVFVCLWFALSPQHDPLSLPEQRRSNYVYVAEAMLALLFMHIRLTMPWLFTGFFERYWPLVVLLIAYAGVATSELLRRRRVLVLAQPIARSGALLPLLPVLGFWVIQSQVDYSLLLFIVGGLYGALSILRRSFLFGLLAAIAGNGGLWYLLHRSEDYRFLQHPQLWLIPAAVSVLIAAYLNREDFSEQQMTGIRYLALLTIYVSSTADIFINGVAQSPWLPPILAALSIVGVFCGIMFRIRAFLILGSVFLLLAITTMIYYASVNFGWTWLWYVAGIITGALIIATFAVFEKKRAEVLRVVDGLKDWQR